LDPAWISLRPCNACNACEHNYQENNVLVLLLVHRGAVTADRKWRCKQIYSYWQGWWVKPLDNFTQFYPG